MDEETGLYYFSARYYDPKTSVWLSVDPLAEKYPNVSSYNYCLGNPVKYTDPTGKNTQGPLIPSEVEVLLSLFAAGVAIDATVQIAVNYAYYGDVKQAFKNIDVVDCMASGAISALTGGGGNIRTFFKEGSKLAFTKGSAILTLEFISASTDLTFNGSGFQSLFNNKKDLFETTSSFVLSMSATMSSEKIVSILKGWAKADINPKLLATMTKSEKELARKVYKIVSSETFSQAIEINPQLLTQYVDKILNSNAKINVKTVEKRDLLKENITQPKDNTNIGRSGGDF